MFLTLLIAIVSIIVLMIIHEFGHFIIAKKFGVKVEEFGIGYPPRMFGKQFGETLYSLNWIPFGAFVKIHGEEGGVDDYRSFSYLVIWKRILICLGGVIAFWIAAWVIFTLVFMMGASIPIGDQDIGQTFDSHIVILEVREDSPAEIAGIKSGDKIIEVSSKADTTDYTTISKLADFKTFIEAHRGQEILVNIQRGENALAVNITPRISNKEGEGATGVVLERMAEIIKQYPFYQAPFYGIKYTGQTTLEALKGIGGFFMSLFDGRGLPAGAELAGPVGITIFISKAAQYGPGFFLYFIGSLTILLAIFNLFPIPALDGGKIVFLLIEKIIGKPIPVVWEQRITIFFFVVLLTLSVFITIKFDIPRVINLWRTGI